MSQLRFRRGSQLTTPSFSCIGYCESSTLAHTEDSAWIYLAKGKFLHLTANTFVWKKQGYDSAFWQGRQASLPHQSSGGQGVTYSSKHLLAQERVSRAAPKETEGIGAWHSWLSHHCPHWWITVELLMSCVMLQEQGRRKPQCTVKTQTTFGR